MGLAIALVLVLLCVVSVIMFSGHYWWFPPLISTYTGYDKQFMLTLIIVAVVFILAQLALGYFVWKYRDRAGRKARYVEGNNTMEVLWTSITFVIFIGLGILGQRVWAQFHFAEAPANAMEVEVTGQQFQWNIRYPGPDGQFGRTEAKYVDESGLNFVGVDPHDPAGKDDITSINRLVIPVNQPVKVLLHSKDVTHSFFVPWLRIKQDAVPGMTIAIHFTATKTGEYEIPCAELCGLGHYKMRGILDVKTPDEFQQWLKKQASQE
ncbi:MAG: cytochrome c oxidase subunit II [Acidobacteriia bacterium]|nr:cytochrome c oxidase subunit II [Terriglobia bacterium]